jgi:pyruvate-formate lyase-activating enzyme
MSYTFENVAESLRLCGIKGIQISLNLLTFPGFTDAPFRVGRLSELIARTGVGMVQLRNLNLDPDILFEELGLQESDEPLGIAVMIEQLISENPNLQIGNYSKPGCR